MTTKFFSQMQIIAYNFGNNEAPVLFDNISQYVDVIDGVKDNISFYATHTILSGDRPDTLSYKLYGTTDYYWTFFLMNDHLRESGWPVNQSVINKTLKEKYPHRMVTTNSIIAKDFPVGTVVTGTSSGTVGTIVKRNLEMGQMVIDTVDDNNYSPTETLVYTSTEGAVYTATLIKESLQYDAVHHYEDANGVHVDLPLYDFGNVPSGATAVTYRDRVENRNQQLKEISVLKPNVVSRVVSEFSNFHKQVI
jgi:hypothetical protein